MTAASAVEFDAAAAAVSTPVALRWFRFAAGLTPEDDYRPIGSDGVGLKLLAEISRVCVAFHPHNGIRQFPRRRPALLFFRASSTDDLVLLRVGLRAGGSDGERLSLEYDGLILTDADFRAFSRNAFAPGDLGLFDRVARAAESSGGGRIDALIPGDAGRAVVPQSDGGLGHLPGGERTFSNDEVDALETLCRYQAAQGDAPPSFATWWESGKPLPVGYFDFVLRAASPRGLTPAAVEEAATRLASDAAETPERDAAEDFAHLLIATLKGCSAMTPPAFRTAMTAAANDISAIAERLAASGENIALAERCRAFADELRKLRHPDPFAEGRFTDVEPQVRLARANAEALRKRQRFMRRNRTLVILSIVASFTIALALAVSLWQRHAPAITR